MTARAMTWTAVTCLLENGDSVTAQDVSASTQTPSALQPEPSRLAAAFVEDKTPFQRPTRAHPSRVLTDQEVEEHQDHNPAARSQQSLLTTSKKKRSFFSVPTENHPSRSIYPLSLR